MPNWVLNRLQLLGPPASVADFPSRLDGDTFFDFDRIRPTPPELQSGVRIDDRTGLPEWRMWRTEHWGCKWNASDVEVERRPDGSAAIKFLTPYGSPLPLLEQLAIEHPDVELVLEA